MFKVSWILDFLLGPKLYFDSQPTTPDKTTTTVELPEWARGYAKDTLAKGAALTDINQNPYQTYGGERIAGFTPMQQQAQQGAANMQTAGQVGLGSGLAGAAGLGALGTNYQGGNFYGGQFNSDAAKQYMNPYMQNVVDIQQREAQRQADIAGTQRNAQAVGAGAFGGSRQAITDAEAARNLATQKGDIQAQGLNQAYGQAANQFNQDYSRNLQAQQLGEQSRQYGAGLGMQGLQTALQSAGTLGQLGQTQYGQQMGINQLQSAYGTQQQQQAQRPLDMAYQDFLNQQNYPYKQLGFMSDMIRGLPLGQQSTSSVYQGSGPGMVQTLAGLGGAAYGFGKSGLFSDSKAAGGGLMESYADGGEVKTYAGDRGSVTSQDNKNNIVEDMYSIDELQKAKRAALNRRDMDTAQAIDERIAELNAIQAQTASIDHGLGSAFNQIPVEQQEAMMAGGGMVAFAKGGDTYGNRFEQSMSALQDMAKNQPPVQTAEQYEQGVMSRQPMVEKLMGEDVTKPYLEETKSKREGLAGQFEKDKGLAFALGSLKLLSPSKKTRGMSEKDQLFSGLGEAGEAFIGEVGRLKKEHTDADDKLRQSEVLLATAQQARKEGNAKLAMSLEDKAAAQKQDAYKTQIGVQEKVATIQGSLAGTELQGKNAKEVAQITAAAHRYAADKPGEMERIMSTVNDIRSGKKVYAGKTGEEGAKAYQDDLSQTGAARYGVKYTGPDPTFANSAKFQAELDKRTSMLQLRKSAPGVTPAEIQDLDRQIETERQKLINEYRDTMASGVTSKNQPAPTAAPVVSDAEKQAAAAKNRDKLGTIVPRIGTIEDGHRFKGGDPANPANWEKV